VLFRLDVDSKQQGMSKMYEKERECSTN
jgi:hypothetical protein